MIPIILHKAKPDGQRVVRVIWRGQVSFNAAVWVNATLPSEENPARYFDVKRGWRPRNRAWMRLWLHRR